ncbi:hypothetical protein SLE2022_202070 [Rubroshorea leprosula]
MMKSTVFRSCFSPVLVEAKDVHRSELLPPSCRAATIRCSLRNYANIPKLKPFNRTFLDRAIKDPPLIEKAERELADYCTTLEGEESYYCWKARFELEDLEKVAPKEDLERIILEAGGVKTLINWIPRIAAIYKNGKENALDKGKPMNTKGEGKRLSHIPEWMPKSVEELEEEEKAKMPDSPYTRLLRTMGRKTPDVNYEGCYLGD